MARPAPPVAPRRPTLLVAHGDERVDDWYWLREREDPEVVAHLEAENAYTRAMTAPTSELAAQLYEEIVARIQESDLSVPVRRGPWLYYSRTEEGRQYAIHCRRPVDTPEEADPGAEQILLDENAVAPPEGFFALGGFAVSPDHSLLAYATDTTGAERYTLRFRDLDSGAATDLGDVVPDVYYGLAWASDDATVFYTRPDGAMRPHQLWRHQLGTAPEEDVCVHEEPDERFYVGVSRTKDGCFILLHIESKVTTEIRVLPADRPDGEFRVLEGRRPGVEYDVAHLGDDFFLVTNDEAENFRLVAAPDDDPGRSYWRDVVAHRADVKLDGIEVFAHHVALFERAEASTRIRVLRLEDGEIHTVEQPEPVSTAWGGPNPELGSPYLRYEYTSLVSPRSVYDYDLDSASATLRKRQPVLGGYDQSLYVTTRLWATAEDSTQVPISLVHRRGLARDGRAPALLYGYGSYEASMDPVFSSVRLSLLERGFVFAIAHVRGGGEMGRSWYEDGKLLNKTHTFTDFVACARHLVAEGWTSPSHLVARGGSAGGLLMGAVANLAPDLFRAIVAEVPFVDCLTTVSDESLPLTVFEWEEWGNPVDDPSVYTCMRSYSPYDNVVEQRYPDLLVTAGLNDPRVAYWEPAKWVQKLRAADPDNRVLLKTEMGAGHQGPSGRYEAWRDEAFVLAFILSSVGIAQADPRAVESPRPDRQAENEKS